MNISNNGYNNSIYYKKTNYKSSQLNKKTMKNTNDYKEELKLKFPNIHYDFESLNSKEQIIDYAKDQSGYYNVAISPEILEKMAGDESVRLIYEKLLENINRNHDYIRKQMGFMGKDVQVMGTVIDDEGEVSIWTVSEKKEDISKKDQLPPYMNTDTNEDRLSTNDNKKKPIISVHYKYSSGSDMIKIARANSAQAVRGIISSTQGEISRAKHMVSDTIQAGRIVKKIKGVIQKGRMKIVRLNKEENLLRRRKIAQKSKKVALERELIENIRRKRVARRGQEQCETIDFDDAFANPTIESVIYKYGLDEYENTMQLDSAVVGATGSTLAIEGNGVDVSGSLSIDVMA